MKKHNMDQPGTSVEEGQVQSLSDDGRMPSSERPDLFRARLQACLGAGIVIAALGSGVLFWQSRESSVPSSTMTVSSEQRIVVEPQAVSQHLDITGTIAAGNSVAIVAPFDGVIREKHSQLGDTVHAGDVLVVMDSSEIASRYRDAQSAYLKAAMAADALAKWQNGPDMLRAKRALEAAQGSLGSLERQVIELKVLLDQGIVSRNEYDGLVQQRDSQKNTVDSAKDELAATEVRGNSENHELVMLDLENAQSRLSDLKQQMAGAEVSTAVAGILTRPPVNGNREPVSVEPGASVTRGAALFAIADTSSFTVAGAVDEIDVNQVKIGQPVAIASDAFPSQPMTGEIVSISAEADQATGGSGSPPRFPVRASFSVPDNTLRAAIKIGMSARMTVETYSNPAALLVPPAAISRNGDYVNIRVMNGEMLAVMPVILGRMFPAGIEVISGLKAGTVVSVTESGEGSTNISRMPVAGSTASQISTVGN